MLVRTSAVVGVAALVAVGMLRPGVPSAETTVYQFLLAWQSKHYLQAAELTTGRPAEVASALAAAYQDLGANELDLAMQNLSQQGHTAEAHFHATFDLGSIGLNWSYVGNFGLTYSGSRWQVVWNPSVIDPNMSGTERLAVVSSPRREQVVDSSGHSLAIPSLAYQVGVFPDRLTDPARTADQIQADTGIPADEIEAQIGEAVQATYFTLMTLSPATYDHLRDKLDQIPGVIVRREQVPLFASIAPDVVGSVGTETASVLRTNGEQYLPGTTVGLSGLQQTFQRQLTGTPRTEVVLLDKNGLPQDLLKVWPGTPGMQVHTTLDGKVQRAADSALAGLPASAAIVAVQAQTGKILAVASHTGGGLPALSPLAGEYKPGQSFTIVSSAAMLAAGTTPSDPVPCRQDYLVGGEKFVNDPPELNLGNNASFQKDFAYACGTAFAGLSESLTSGQLTQAAARFGIGGWQLPVSSFFAGSIGSAAGDSSLAADVIGTGGVRVSPLGMALAAAVVDSGRWHGPSLVTDLTDASTVPWGLESQAVLSALRGLMHGAATTGANKVADIDGDVYGQVGNAPFSEGRGLRIGWYVGYQGDIAFAVVELGSSASGSAAPLAGTFLQNIKTGS